MYSVFIVDDEQIVLEGIRNKIDWDNSDFTFAGEATDGEIALSMIQEVKPDILITDIKMPFLDGLELSRILKKIQPWIRIIILSGHDEFDYAKKAISIGVEDYILKPFTGEEILRSLKKISASLDVEKKQFTDMNKLKEELESNSNLRRSNFLTDVVLGTTDFSTVVGAAEEFGINLLSHFYKIIISDIRHSENRFEDMHTVRSKLVMRLKNQSECLSFFIGPQKLVSILLNNSETDIVDAAYNLTETIEHLVCESEGYFVVSSMGKTVEHIANISASYSEAEQMQHITYEFKSSRVIDSDDMRKSDSSVLNLDEKDSLADRLKFANSNDIDDIVNYYANSLSDNPVHFTIVGSYLFVNVIMSVSKFIESLGGDVNEILPQLHSHAYIEESVKNRDVFLSNIRTIIETVLKFRDKSIQGRYSDVILKAKDYIQKNYASQDTCLRLVAEEVHLSPNHFSTIFSQECGTTFIEYLTNVRVEAAKKLLKETEMKGADIAYECGFSDPHYFSFIFKKTTGVSPREYKVM